jgi:hypothetical protein
MMLKARNRLQITDAGQETSQSLLIHSALELELMPQRERLVVVRDHRQHVGVVAELGEEGSRDGPGRSSFEGLAWRVGDTCRRS